jgi:hypothetical protein
MHETNLVFKEHKRILQHPRLLPDKIPIQNYKGEGVGSPERASGFFV